MFAPLARFFNRQPDPAEADGAFVKHVRVAHPREPRSRRSELVLVVGWVLIVAKCGAIWWLCATRPEIPFSPWWLIGPTLAFAALCTWLYLRRD